MSIWSMADIHGRTGKEGCDNMDHRQLTRIRVEGFKSIESADIELNMVNVLIGSNGSGKTNFISVLSLLQALIAGDLQNYVARKGGPDSFLYWGRKRTEKMSVEFYFGNNGYRFSLIPTANNQFMIADEAFYWNIIGWNKLPLAGTMESSWKSGTGTHIDEYVQPLLENQNWRVYHFHDTSDSAYVKQLQGINDNIELADDARNLAAFLYRLRETVPAAYQRIVKTVQMAAPYFNDFVLRPNPLNPEKISLEWKADGSDVPFIAAQLSDGTLRFICLATLLLQPVELQPETILIDEPELGLHPYAIQLLAAMIKKAAKERQIIVSTQSVELLNEFQAEDVLVVEHKYKSTTFKRVDEEKLAVWLEDDYTLGDLWKHNLLGGRP